MKNLLLTLTCVSAMALHANAQTAGAAAEIVTGAGKAVSAAPVISKGVTSSLPAAGGAMNAVGAAARPGAVGAATTKPVVKGPVCKTDVFGRTDVRKAVELEVLSQASVCGSGLEGETERSNLGTIAEAIAWNLDGVKVNVASTGQLVKAAKAGLEKYQGMTKDTSVQTTQAYLKIIGECDFVHPALKNPLIARALLK